MYVRPYYINPDGDTIEYDDLSSHVGLATRIIETDPKLKEEFIKSGIKLSTDFLVDHKGFIQVTNEAGNGYYRNKIVFSASKMNQKLKTIVMGYILEGYEYENRDTQIGKNKIQQFHEFIDE